MNKQTFFFIFFFITICCNIATARIGGISGKVLDETGKPVSFASVILLKAADSVFVKTELTNDNGEYSLSPVMNGSYVIKVLLLGYDTYKSGSVLVGDNTISLPEVRLHETEATLKGVTVTAQKAFVEVHPDKLVVNVENSIVSAGSSVLDVLAKSPGVTVDQDDNISVKGKQGVNIMIDGRTVPVSAADLANMLKSMPSGSVDKIEIITNPSAKYDAAGTAGIINIKTKKDKKTGFNGSINGSYGQGVYPKETGGINLNYRKNKLNVYANYNADNREGLNKVHWVRSFYGDAGNTRFNGAYIQDNYTTQRFNSNVGVLGADYNISSKTSIGASLNGDAFHLGSKGYYFANVQDKDHIIQSNFATNNTSSGSWNNYAPNVHFRHEFDTTGKELTIDGDYARYWNTNRQDFTTIYDTLGRTSPSVPYVLHGDIAGVTQIRSLKADYVNPLKNNAKIEAGIKASFVTADNEPKFYDRTDGADTLDKGKSDHFIYNENINAAYFNASKEWTKWGAQFGLRAEQTIVNGEERYTGQTFEHNYTQLFPSLAVQNHINPSNDLGVTVSRRIERPSYQSLNPYKFFVDPSTVKIGNPYLNRALTYACELSHVYKQRLITTLSYSYTSNVITEVLEPSLTQDRVTIQTERNLARMNYYGISGSYTIPVFKWWNTITNVNGYYSEYQGNLANTQLKTGKPTCNIYVSNKFTMPKEWSAELSGFYQSAQVYGYMSLTPISMINVGVQKNMLDKRLTLRFNANDIFWRGNENGVSAFSGYVAAFYTKHDTRQATIAVTYRFGKKGSPMQKHESGAEEEKKRAKSMG